MNKLVTKFSSTGDSTGLKWKSKAMTTKKITMNKKKADDFSK